MGFSDETYAAARKYTDDTVAGAGGLAGVPCQIQSITSITGGNRVTFLWIDNNGNEHTSTMNVMNGVDGEDGKGIQSVSVNAENHLIITYTDGTTADAGQIEIHSAVDSVNGQTGIVSLDAEDVGALPDDTPIPSKTSNLTNDSGFITKAVNDLVNYYLKSETYSKTQVDDIIAAVKNSRFEVVATLPTTDIKTNVIYLVPKSPSQTSNVKDEYINLDGTTAGWEKIGDTEIDLSDYVTTQALNTALADYTTTADLTTLLAAKQDTLTFDNVPTKNSNNPVKSGGVYSANNAIYSVMGINGAKNLVDVPDFTLIKDTDRTKSVDIRALPKRPYICSFDVTDASDPINGQVQVFDINNYAVGGVTITENGHYSFPVSADHDDYRNIYAYINSTLADGTTMKISNFMIRLASDTDSTYQPYAKTNKELTAENQTLTNNVDVLFETGVKNICPPYLGSYSANGITYIGNSDGTVTANGTCSANVGTNIRVYLKAGQYKVSGCPSGGSYSTYRIGVTTDSWTLIGTHDHGNGTTITIPSDDYYRINLDVRAGYVANNLVFKPMITDVDTPESDYDHYVPYAKTNQQLTEDSIDWDNFSELGAVNLAENKGTTTTHRGITFTVNADGTVTASGTNDGTGDSTIILTQTAADHLETTGIYKLSGCPSGGSDSTYYLVVYQGGFGADDYGDGVVFTNNNYGSLKLACVVKSGTDLATDITFKPMIAPVSYNGPYVPYAKTNRELTKDVADARVLIGSVNQHVSVIADGTKTIQTLMQELHSALSSLVASLNTDETIYILGARSDGGTWFRPSNVELKYSKSSTVGNISMDSFTVTAGENCYHYSLTFSSTLATNTFRQMTVAQSGNTFVNRTSDVPSANSQLLLTYQIYKTIS